MSDMNLALDAMRELRQNCTDQVADELRKLFDAGAYCLDEQEDCYEVASALGRSLFPPGEGYTAFMTRALGDWYLQRFREE